MNKTELIKKISDQTGITKNIAKITLDATLHSISQSLNKGEAIKLIGFGAFRVTNRKARICHNPRTRERFAVPPRTGVKFKASCHLIDHINSASQPIDKTPQGNQDARVTS